MSFFTINKNFILEIQQYIHEESTKQIDCVFQVFNFAEWSLFSPKDSTLLNVLKSKENLLMQTRESSNKPFGVIVSSPHEIELAAQYAHFLYIPGEICRQSDILESSAKTNLPLFIERGVFLAPNDIARVIEKLGNADIALVDSGSANGYSDAILDPRVLAFMQNTKKSFGVHLSNLISPDGTTYSQRPNWLSNLDFIDSFIKTAHTFGASFFVIKNYGKGNVPLNLVLPKMPRNI